MLYEVITGVTTNTRAMHWTIGLGLAVAAVGIVLGLSSLWGLSFSSNSPSLTGIRSQPKKVNSDSSLVDRC